MSVPDALYSSFHKWYPLFKDYTFTSVIIDIPSEVLTYLNEDGVILPIEAVTPKPDSEIKWYSDEGSPNSQTASCSEGSEELCADVKQPTFPEFSEKLKSAMNNMNRNVFIKGNWNAPTDASWIILNKSLKSSTIEDVYLLLKSSSRLLENFNSPFNGGSCIVLKKWEDIHPSSEFRCFVFNKVLIGITQRDCTDFHPYISTARMDIISDIVKFFSCNIKNTFQLKDYSFDVVRYSTRKVILVDFGVFNEKHSRTYLFTWDELLDIGNTSSCTEGPEFRYISSPSGVQPRNDFTGFCLPYELANIRINSDSEVTGTLVEIAREEINRDGG